MGRLTAKHLSSEDIKYRIGYRYWPMFAGMYWTIGIPAKTNIGTTLVLCGLLRQKYPPLNKRNLSSLKQVSEKGSKVH